MKPTHVSLPVLARLTGWSRATVERRASRGDFGPLAHAPGCAFRFRSAELGTVERLLGTTFTCETVAAAVAAHALAVKAKRHRRHQYAGPRSSAFSSVVEDVFSGSSPNVSAAC